MCPGTYDHIVCRTLRMCENDVAEDEIRKKTGVSQITPALEYVRNEYANNIRVEELAKASHMSETHFRRVFESYMNMSPMDYINLMRVQKACDIMKRRMTPWMLLHRRLDLLRLPRSTGISKIFKYIAVSVEDQPGKLREKAVEL